MQASDSNSHFIYLGNTLNQPFPRWLPKNTESPFKDYPEYMDPRFLPEKYDFELFAL